jgi:hypothetical protein
MGTSLYISGNHTVKFKEKNFTELVREVGDKLNKIAFVNEDFLRNNATGGDRSARWKAREEDEYYNFSESGKLEFEGPYGLAITIDKSRVEFDDPVRRYYRWFTEEKNTRDQWRIYLYQVLKCLDGNKVIYLADNGHYLERYLYYAFEGSFEEMELLMEKELGKPKKSFDEISDVFDDEDFPFFVDTFSDIYNLA